MLQNGLKDISVRRKKMGFIPLGKAGKFFCWGQVECKCHRATKEKKQDMREHILKTV